MFTQNFYTVTNFPYDAAIAAWKYAWGTMQMVRCPHNNFFFWICHSHFVSYEGRFIFWSLCILFFQNPSGMYNFWMHCVEIVGLIMRDVSYARCVGVGLDVSKLGFVCEMLLWVQDSSTAWVGPLEVKAQFPLKRSCLCVCVYLYLTLWNV